MSDENDETEHEDDGTEEAERDHSDGSDDRLPMDRVNDLIAREGRKAGRKAVKALLEDLGLGSADELKSVVTSAREREDSERTELERAQATAAAADARIREAEARAARAELSDRLGRALRTHTDEDGNGLPVREERFDVALDMALGHALNLDDDDEDRVAAGVARVLSSSPEWFGTGTGDDDDGDPTALNGRTPNVRGRSPKDRRGRPKSAATRGAEAARAFGGGFTPPIPD